MKQTDYTTSHHQKIHVKAIYGKNNPFRIRETLILTNYGYSKITSFTLEEYSV